MTTEQQAIFDTILRVLNEGFKADSGAIDHLITNKVECNLALAEHPTIQVTTKKRGLYNEHYLLGTLGLINGIVKPLTGERIASMREEDGSLTGFIQYKRSD